MQSNKKQLSSKTETKQNQQKRFSYFIIREGFQSPDSRQLSFPYSQSTSSYL